MSEVTATSSASSSTAAASTSSTAAASSSPAPTSLTTINSLAELKEKAPQVYHQMMLSFGMTICQDMQKGQDRIKQTRKQYDQS